MVPFNLANKPSKRLDAAALMSYALRTLGARGQSRGELREKLARRAARAQDVDIVLGDLGRAGYLDDQRFAESFASARLENEGLGRARVLRDLRQRRVAPKLAEQVVEKTFRDRNEIDLIDAYLTRKYRGKELQSWLADEKNLASAYRRLRYAGFSSGNSIQVLKNYTHRAEELENIEEIPEGRDEFPV